MKPFDWMLSYIVKYKIRYGIAIAMAISVSVLALVNPYIAGRIVDEVFEKGNYDALIPLLLVMVSATAGKSVIRYISLMIFEYVSQGVTFNIRRDIYKRVQDQSFNFFDSNRVGDIMSRMTGDLDAVRHFCAHVVFSSIENLLIFIAAMILMFSLSFYLTLSIVIVAAVIAVVAMKQSKEIKPYFTKIREQFSALNSVCQENISGNRVVKAFTREAFEIEKFGKENRAYSDANIDSYKVWTKYLPMQEFLAGLLSVIVVLLGGLLVIFGKMELWKLVAINGYLWAINNPTRIIGWLVNDIQRVIASLEKIHNMMKMKIDITNPTNPVHTDIKGAVEFKNVCFSYNGENKEVLKNISFRVKAGQTVGIVGPTGSGKTTILNLISRYYDSDSGDVLVDGVNVKSLDLRNLRKSIASSMQDVFLFSDTVEGNIAYGVPDAPLEELAEAAKTAQAHEFIQKMEDGYDTIVGERGVGLSGGQKQRLSLSRAVAVNPSILIFDDTTSAVDMETEHEIQTALNEKYGGKTKFIVAHRLSSVIHSDLIIVLVGGEIIEMGTHSELMEKSGYYYGLFNSQYGEYTKFMQFDGQVI